MSPSDADRRADLLQIVARGRYGTLTTLKRDGRPQLSVVLYGYFPEEGLLRISVTASRAKTRNLIRDPRASLMVMEPETSQYAVVESTVTLSPVATAVDDATVEELIVTYRAIRGEHTDCEAHRASMVADQRLVVRMPLDHLYGAP